VGGQRSLSDRLWREECPAHRPMASFVGPIECAPLLQTLLDERVLHLPDRLLELLPVGVYVCDRAGHIVRYNRAAAELWGCSPKVGDPRFVSAVLIAFTA
jgi:PAS domain-containing protein